MQINMFLYVNDIYFRFTKKYSAYKQQLVHKSQYLLTYCSVP